MDKMTKPQLRKAIQEFGEIPAESWNVAELRHRLRELCDEQEEEWAFAKGSRKDTPLQQQITQLNKNKHRKSELIEYVTRVLGLTVTSNETMHQIESKALNHLYMSVESTAKDVVGFGRHAALTYAELYEGYPQYTAWVIQTYQESDDHNPKLKRLARWLTRATDVTAPVVPQPKVNHRGQMVLKVKGGYVTEPEPEIPQFAKAASSGGTPYVPDQMTMMQAMMESMEQMKNEIKELKGKTSEQEERPRKKEK